MTIVLIMVIYIYIYLKAEVGDENDIEEIDLEILLVLFYDR